MKSPFLIFFFLIAFWVKGDNRIFNRISTDAGLSSARVMSIAQDKQGYMWFGTSEGLNRYDGFTFTLFHTEIDNPNSIQKSTIEHLFADKAGNIWITFFSEGISFYDQKTETFVNFKKEELEQQLRIYGKITCFASISTDIVWIGTENGLLSYQYSTRTLKRHTTSSVVSTALINQISTAKDKSIWISTLFGFSQYHPEKNDFTDYTIRENNTSIPTGATCVLRDREGFLWVGTSKYGAFRSIEPEMKSPVFIAIGKPHTHVYQFMETWNGSIWIGHNKGATLLLKTNGNNIETEHFFDQTTDLSPTGECQIRSIQEDKNGTVWFSDNRFNQGQFYYSPATKKTGQLQYIPENPYSLASNQITCQYIDRFNNLWIGHDNYGISFCDLNKPVFNYTFGYMNNPTHLSSNHVLAIHEDSSGNLWIGTIKGLDRINHNTGLVDKRYVFSSVQSNTSLSGKIIGSITEDDEQKLWITYIDASPDRIDLNSLSVLPVHLSEETIDPNARKTIPKACRDQQGNIWMTTSNMELIQYEATNKTIFYTTKPFTQNKTDEDIYNVLHSICADKDNHIWIGKEGAGLILYNRLNKSYKSYQHSENDKTSLISDYVRVIFCDNQGNIWVGTNAGLDKYNRKTSTFDHFTVLDGLPGNVIQSIEESVPDILFIGTNKGLCRMNTRTGDIVNYSKDNKLLTNEFIPDVSFLKRSGELVFGTNNGIMTFDPRILQDEQTNVSLFIPNIYVNGKKHRPEKLNIPYSESKDLKIEFLSFNFIDPLMNNYQYKLTGYDTDWRSVDSKNRYSEYFNLPSGKYTFLVRVSEGTDSWSYPISLSITIESAWWQTWWFRLITALLIISLLYLVYRSRLRIYQIQQKSLEKKVEERTALLRDAKQTLENKNKEMEELYNKLKSLDEQKTAFFTNISHELRTPLTIIKGMTENLEQEEKLATTSPQRKNTIYTIQRNTQRLIRHVNELLDLATMDKGSFRPHITYTNLGKLLYELKPIFEPLAEKYKITFRVEISLEIQNAFFDRDIIEQALFNVLSNAFKYTPDGGLILLTAEYIDNENEPHVCIRIKDNGIGIPAKALPYIFDRYYQNKHNSFQRFESSGIGLAHTKERIESHFGSITCESREGEGTTLTLVFPVSETSFPPDWVELKEVISQSNIFKKEIRLSSLKDEEEEKHEYSEDKRTLLFIEDNRDLLHYLAASFGDEYRIITAGDGQTGFEKAIQTLPDAIISDIMMPVMDGLELCEKLKTEERTAHIPILLLTARAEEKQQLEGYYAGADDYILKPFNIDIIKAKIKSLISRTEKIQSLFKESFDLQKPEEHIPEVEKAFIRKATQIVLDNLQDSQFDVDKFCSEMAMSRANLFRKLKAATGLSASTFTRNIRLKKAAELLKQKEYTVNEVATFVGFSDANYLARCFKEFYGVTPSQYLPNEDKAD